MNPDKEKLARAKEILRKMANGINPLNDEQIGGDSFLHDPGMVRCLYFVLEALDYSIEGPMRTGLKKPSVFVITTEEKKRIELPQERIGVNEFAKCVNKVLDLNKSKTLSGMEINKKLKQMGILSEESLPDGKKRTVLTARSYDNGVETEKRNYNGNEYEMVLFNEKGKKFLIDNLERIMGIET